MCIDHVAMYVNDLEVAKNFFVKYFNVKVNSKYNNPRNKFSSYFLSFEGGSRLEIMTRSTMTDLKKEKYRSGFHHIAVDVGDRKDVDYLTQKMENDGILIVSRARTTGDGYYEAVVLDPEGNAIELIAGNTVNDN